MLITCLLCKQDFCVIDKPYWVYIILQVINWETSLRIPKKANIADSAADLILQLCRVAESRLGRNGVDEIKQHPFFAPIDFNSDLRKTRAPYIPKITHSTDTSNFDPIDSGKLRSSSESSDSGDLNDRAGDNDKHPEHAFLEFTFRRFFDDGGQVYPSRTPSLDETPDKQSSPVYVWRHENLLVFPLLCER